MSEELEKQITTLKAQLEAKTTECAEWQAKYTARTAELRELQSKRRDHNRTKARRLAKAL